MFAFLRDMRLNPMDGPSICLPVSRCQPGVKPWKMVVFNPCTKNANMGHPSKRARLEWEPGTAADPVSEHQGEQSPATGGLDKV